MDLLSRCGGCGCPRLAGSGLPARMARPVPFGIEADLGFAYAANRDMVMPVPFDVAPPRTVAIKAT